VDLGFQGLVVLAFDLKLGLEFLYQEFETRDFGAKFLGVAAGYGAQRSGWLRGLIVCGLARLSGLAGVNLVLGGWGWWLLGPDAGYRLKGICGLSGLKPGVYIGMEGFGKGAGPRGFRSALFGRVDLRGGVRWSLRRWRRRREKAAQRVCGAAGIGDAGNVGKSRQRRAFRRRQRLVHGLGVQQCFYAAD